ncbi:ABC transporter ATP-binding protein [Listeria costaricensis]|uniref:ABC transporter ATP-binding protein n=1 Tax=Listeria costaricensis TaxID=2026604 RepID=UPI000C06F050|nr:ABC transporter ATP-binding protein [Listeria costaricensis]
MAVLEVKGITKKFGKFTALNGIDLQLDKGEILGFIGPNGAGKSTTIRVLLGIIRANSGSSKIFGKDSWQDAVDIHKDIAYVPGDVVLWPNLTGGEVIDLFAKLRGGKINQARRDELIRRFDLDVSKKCRTYSKGNRQKVALVAAFSSEAELYILDEPTSGLDPLMEKVFQDCVFEAKRAGKSVLLSSHILSEVEKLCDTVAIIRQGEIIESGSLAEMRHLTRLNFMVETSRPVPELPQIEGVFNVETSGQQMKFQVDSERLADVMEQLAPYGIVKLESSPPNLEDLFMRHYEHEGMEKSMTEGGGRE